jgi:uncharacterized protein (DUF1800 family)
VNFTPITTGYNYLANPTDAQAARFLLQAQFSASDADIADVKTMGYAAWITAQFKKSYSTGWDLMVKQGYTTCYTPLLPPGSPSNTAAVDSGHFYFTNDGDTMMWSQLCLSTAPMRMRMALALNEILVVSLEAFAMVRWSSELVAAYWDFLTKHVTGNYRDLIEALSKNAAMGAYLTLINNPKEDPATGRTPDENYARELMQLFTIGLAQLDLRTGSSAYGSPLLDANGAITQTYTQDDIVSLAHVFTGWGYDYSQDPVMFQYGADKPLNSPTYCKLPLVNDASQHSTFSPVVMLKGTPQERISTATDAQTQLTQVLDTLFNHQNTPAFFCKRLIQRLVTSNPSGNYVERVSTVFRNDGNGVRGNLAAVFTAILLDDEARGPAGLTAPTFGKVREPMIRLVQWARSFGARLDPKLFPDNDIFRIGNLSNPEEALGQSPMHSPTVFNFFKPDYQAAGSQMTAANMVAPEFGIVNESTVAGYINYMTAVIGAGIGFSYVTDPANPKNSYSNSSITAQYTQELAQTTNGAIDPTKLVNRLNLIMCANQLSTSTVNAFVSALTSMSNAASLDKVKYATLMVMSSPEYLVQK